MLDKPTLSARETARQIAEIWFCAFAAAPRGSRIFSCTMALQIDAIDTGRLARARESG